MKRTIVVAIMIVVAVGWMAGGCGRGREGITMAGSTAFQPFAEKVAERYMSAHPEVSITVQGGGSAMGIQAAQSGAAEIGMADLVKLPPEAAGLREIEVARDGIAMIVHPSNPVRGLTLAQIRSIFNGKLRNWKEVGGEDKPISVVSREAGSGTRTSFEQIVGEIDLLNDAIIQDSNGTIRETVANDPGAIGYISHGLLNDRIKAVDVDGSACTEMAIMSGAYTLVRPIFLLCKPDARPVCVQFLEYMRSNEAQELIHDNGLIRAGK